MTDINTPPTLLRIPRDLGLAVKARRQRQHLRVKESAARSGRSRDTLNRLERGGEVTTGAMFDLLRAMGLSLRLVEAGLPSAGELAADFFDDDER